MTDEDKARAAERLLAEPMLVEALALVEREAIETMMLAADSAMLKEGRDYVLAVRALPGKLHAAMVKVQEAKRSRMGVV